MKVIQSPGRSVLKENKPVVPNHFGSRVSKDGVQDVVDMVAKKHERRLGIKSHDWSS